MPRRVTPKSLVLDLLRVAAPRAIPIRALIDIGALFGLKGNAIRVAVTRLVAKGLLESDERGYYELAAATTPVSEHVEQWRLGEQRVGAWNGDWLCVWLPRGAARTERRRSVRSLELVGFREGLDGMWVRPNNLAADLVATIRRLEALGLEAGAEPFAGSRFDEALTHRWSASLWNAKQLVRGYVDARANLERSLGKVDGMPAKQAVVESFMLGGAAIRVLATDPLLPEAIVPGCERARLTEAMVRYDAVGRRLWSQLYSGEHLDSAPSHVSSIDGYSGAHAAPVATGTA